MQGHAGLQSYMSPASCPSGAQSPCFSGQPSCRQRRGRRPLWRPHLRGGVLLQVPGLALLAGEAVQAVEALLQGCFQLLLVGVCVFGGGCGKFLLENSYLQQAEQTPAERAHSLPGSGAPGTSPPIYQLVTWGGCICWACFLEKACYLIPIPGTALAQQPPEGLAKLPSFKYAQSVSTCHLKGILHALWKRLYSFI